MVAATSDGKMTINGRSLDFDEAQALADMPSCGEALKGLANSVYAIAKSGIKVVTNEEHEERFSKCIECHHLVGGRCSLCGCFMKVKSKFASMDCPLGKW